MRHTIAVAIEESLARPRRSFFTVRAAIQRILAV
jgi:hypothetical protein